VSEVVANTADSRSLWRWVTLADVGKVITGNTPPTSDAENYGDAIPFVKPTELVDRGIRSAPSGLSTQAIGKARVVPAGAVLVSCIGNLGKTGIAKVPLAFNQQINAVVFNENVLPEFGFYYAQTLKPWLYGESSATTIPIVNKGKFQQVRFPLAPMSEQRAIVAEIEKQFSRLDEAVANLQRVKANLKRYKASVLKAAVEGRLVETEASIAQREGRSYETGEQLLQRILEDRKALAKVKRVAVNQPDPDGLPDCPEGWVWTTCDAAINSIDAGASFKCEERPPLSGEVGVLKVSALTWGTYDENESKTCKDEGRIEEEYLVRDGDFLFSRANTIELVGACVIVGKTTKQLMLSDKTLRLKLDKRVLPDWLLICMRCQFGRDEIKRLATGNQESMRNIGQERIRQIRMPLPSIAEQKRIVAEVDRHLSIVRGVEAEVDVNIQRAQALRQAALAKSFASGQ
jgi:type I restriction enzyme, S subunit